MFCKYFAAIREAGREGYRECLEGRVSDRPSDKVLPQKTPPKLRDLIRFEVSLCFVCRKVYPERLEARISTAAKKLKITQR